MPESLGEFRCLDGEGAVCGECEDCTPTVDQDASMFDVLRSKREFIPGGFRDDDGVWHDGPHQVEFDAALGEVTASYDLAVSTGNALRMACGEAILVTTADEVRMPREDWERIVDAAIAQRRAVDPTAVPDE